MESNQILVPSPQSLEREDVDGLIKVDSSQLGERHLLCRSIGCAWRLLPGDFCPWQTVYGITQWSQDWTGLSIHDTLRDWLRKTEGRNVARQRPSWTANRSKRRIKRENAAMTRAKRSRAASAIWRWNSLGLILGLMITSAVQDRDAAKPLIRYWLESLALKSSGPMALSGKLLQWLNNLRPYGK